MKIDIKKCPRCGETHGNQEFSQMGNPVDAKTQYGGILFWWFWVCPTKNQPVLVWHGEAA